MKSDKEKQLKKLYNYKVSLRDGAPSGELPPQNVQVGTVITFFPMPYVRAHNPISCTVFFLSFTVL